MVLFPFPLGQYGGVRSLFACDLQDDLHICLQDFLSREFCVRFIVVASAKRQYVPVGGAQASNETVGGLCGTQSAGHMTAATLGLPLIRPLSAPS